MHKQRQRNKTETKQKIQKHNQKRFNFIAVKFLLIKLNVRAH